MEGLFDQLRAAHPLTAGDIYNGVLVLRTYYVTDKDTGEMIALYELENDYGPRRVDTGEVYKRHGRS